MPGDHAQLCSDDALEPLRAVVRGRFPEARFAYREAPDGLRVYLDVATDCQDDFAVLEAVAPAAIEVYLQRGILVHVFPFRRLPG